MRVLVTGGAGFLGSHLTRALTGRGDTVAIIDNFATADPRRLQELKGVQVFDTDVANAEQVDGAVASFRPDAICHLGAVASTGQAMALPAGTVRINLEGTVNILMAMRKHGVSRALSVSSEETYGAFRYEPCDETHPQEPASAYGITKVAAERYADYFHQLYGTNMINVRTSWVYGPGYPRNRIETRIILDALEGKESVFASGADHRIDYTWVDDFVRGMLLLLDKPQLRYRAYNIAGGRAYTGAQVVALLQERMPEARVTLGRGLLEYAPGFQMPQKGALDIARAHSDLGYWPEVDLATGLDRYIAYLREHRNG